MKLLVLSPEKKVFEDVVEQVTAPGTAGPFQVLKGHAPLISTLAQGVLHCSGLQMQHAWNIESGTLEVRCDQVTVLLHQLPVCI